MKVRLRFAAVGSALVIAAGLGVIPGTALASTTAGYFCNFPAANGETMCSYTSPSQGAEILMEASDGFGGSQFFIPPAGTYGQIRLNSSNGDLCMEQDAARSNEIVLAACEGKAAEEWATEDLSNDRVAFVNEYTLDCINDDYYINAMNGAECNFGTNENEQWVVLSIG